jgi:hypothetical protein
MTSLKMPFVSMLLPAAFLCGIASIGCGAKGVPTVKTEMVEGIVTLDGKPVPGAMVTFVPVQDSAGAAATGTSDEAGKYHLTAISSGKRGEVAAGTLPGEYFVGVLKDEFPDLDRLRSQESGTVSDTDIKVVHVVPQKFNDPRTSGVKVSVQSGKNDIPIELKSN